MGLWVRTAVSYVLVTLGAVLLVEAVLIGVYAPRAIDTKANEQTVLHNARDDASGLALKLSGQASADDGVGFPAASHLVPQFRGTCLAAAKADILYIVLNPDGTVLDSSYPDCYPVGGAAPSLPGAGGQDGVGPGTGGNRYAWARAAIVQAPPGTLDGAATTGPANLAKIPQAHQIATLYEQQIVTPPATRFTFTGARPLLLPGLVVLGGAIPVGLLFGYVSMRRPVRRLRRLAATTQALADGDLERRIQVTGRDELSQLEADINRMAERLSAAMALERALTDTRARTTERARIARDLHDSVSQDLFCLRLLAGGVARAVPDDSPLRPQLRQMEDTATTATQQMRAMLLQLRPAAPTDGGLAAALDTLAQTYRHRVGITVHTELAEIELATQHEHALLRIAHEALVNAVRHGNPTEMTVTLTTDLLRIHDNGQGFDPGEPALGMGLALMRDRAAEIGGVLSVSSSTTTGTTVEVRLP